MNPLYNGWIRRRRGPWVRYASPRHGAPIRPSPTSCGGASRRCGEPRPGVGDRAIAASATCCGVSWNASAGIGSAPMAGWATPIASRSSTRNRARIGARRQFAAGTWEEPISPSWARSRSTRRCGRRSLPPFRRASADVDRPRAHRAPDARACPGPRRIPSRRRRLPRPDGRAAGAALPWTRG